MFKTIEDAKREIVKCEREITVLQLRKKEARAWITNYLASVKLATLEKRQEKLERIEIRPAGGRLIP